MMKSLLLRGVAVSALMTSSAFAADLAKAPRLASAPVPPVYNWTGFYGGINAGADFARSGDPSTSASCTPLPGFGFSPIACADVPFVNAAGTGAISHSGFTGGGQFGYNWQSNAAVLGAEVDFKSFSAKASRTGTSTNPATADTTSVSNSVDAHWLMTVRGRAGWAVDNVLYYATGGLAVTDLGSSNAIANPGGGGFPLAGTWGTSSTKAGWTAGAGVEWGVARNWTVRAEYLYVHFDTVTANGVVTSPGFAGYGSAISTSTDLSAHIARAGLNYRF